MIKLEVRRVNQPIAPRRGSRTPARKMPSSKAFASRVSRKIKSLGQEKAGQLGESGRRRAESDLTGAVMT